MNALQEPSTIPSVLVQNNATDETQDVVLNTVKLEPNAHSNTTTRWVLPKAGTVLDSNSSLVWSLSWDGYNSALDNGDQKVCVKFFSGALNSMRRARLYVGGRLLFTNPDPAQTIHIHKLSNNPDHLEEVVDKKLGGQHGYYITGSGKCKNSADVSYASSAYNLCSRGLGSYSTTETDNKSWEATVLLS